MGNKISSISDSYWVEISNINQNLFHKSKKANARVSSSDESTNASPPVSSPPVPPQLEAGIRKKLQLQIPPKRTRPSLQIKIPGSLSAGSYSEEQHETFIRFNELVNALENLREIPADVHSVIKTQIQSSAIESSATTPTLSAIASQYMRDGELTKYALGEALAEMLTNGSLNPSTASAQAGEICKKTLDAARLADPALNTVMNHLLGEDGDIKPADSPLPRATKETHSSEFMALCTRSSRRGAIDMPGTRFVIDELKAQAGEPFAGVHLYQVQHGFDTDETQARGLFELGMEPKNLWYFPKTGARPLVLGRLGNMGSNIYDKPYDLRSSRNSTTGHLVQFLDKSFGIEGKSIAEQIETLTAYKTGTHPHHPKPKVLLVDSGFKIGKSLVELQLSTEPLVRQKYALIAELCPMVAHTQGDIIKGNKALRDAEKVAKERNIVVPILPRSINMAQSTAKDFEGFSVGHEVWLATNRLLDKMAPPEVIAHRPKEALLMGYGIVSAKAQAPLQAGYDVWVWDIDPAALLRAYTDHEKNPGEGAGKVHIPVSREILERVMARGGKRDDPEFVRALAAAKKDWFSHGHITIGNTGAPVGCLRADDFDLLPNGAILSSGASGDYEFGTTKTRKSTPSLKSITAEDGKVKFPIGGPAAGESHEVPLASGDESYFDHQVFETKSGTPDAKRFMIVRGGYAANRMYGIPPAFIDVVKAIMIRSMYEAIQPHSDSRPPSGLWLVDPDSAAQDCILEVIQKNLAEKNLGRLDEPNFSNVDLNWHRPSMPPSPRAHSPAERAGYTSERFVHSGLSACRAYNISPSSFALICGGVNADLFASEDLHLLHQEMFSTQAANDVVALEVARPQRSIAHTLYSIFAREATASKEGLDAEINAVRKHLRINDHQWATLLASPDEFGFTPDSYAVLPEKTPEEDADDLQRARRSMQNCISVLSIGAPTREQLKGMSDRKEKLMSDFQSHIAEEVA